MMTLTPDLFAGVNAPLDPANLTDLEKRHLPVITAPETVKAGEFFEVTVEVGRLLPHPSERAHFIHVIELYAGPVALASFLPTAVTTSPILKASVRLSKNLGPLRAREACNLHGIWEATKDVAVL